MSKNLTECVVGGGCFWCLEAIFQEVIGVHEVVNGYAGGTTPNPSYQTIHADEPGGHAEVVKVTFDSSVLPPEVMLDLFFLSHDPTTLNRQGNDVGQAYRSILLYKDEIQRTWFEAAKERATTRWEDPIVTEIKPLEHFYEAEADQQDYFKNNPNQAYCQVVIAPKLHKVRQHYAKWFTVNHQ